MGTSRVEAGNLPLLPMMQGGPDLRLSTDRVSISVRTVETLGHPPSPSFMLD